MVGTKNNFHLDWLRFTFDPMYYNKDFSLRYHCEDTVGYMFELFRNEFPMITDSVLLDEFISVNARFYDHAFMNSENVRISFDDKYINKGVLVDIPARMLKTWIEFLLPEVELNCPEFISWENLQNIFLALREHNCYINRFDLAFDDYDKVFTPNDYKYFEANNRIVSRCSAFSWVKSTFYIGSRNTGRLLRIYDKDKESRNSDHHLDCIRYEFEFTHDFAKQLSVRIMQGQSCSFTQMILDTFKIVEEHNFGYDHRDRAADYSLWFDWLNSQNNTIFNRYIEISDDCSQETSIQKKSRWVSSCSKAINKTARCNKNFFNDILKPDKEFTTFDLNEIEDSIVVYGDDFTDPYKYKQFQTYLKSLSEVLLEFQCSNNHIAKERLIMVE